MINTFSFATSITLCTEHLTNKLTTSFVQPLVVCDYWANQEILCCYGVQRFLQSSQVPANGSYPDLAFKFHSNIILPCTAEPSI